MGAALKISRTTVVTAYRELESRGLLRGYVGRLAVPRWAVVGVLWLAGSYRVVATNPGVGLSSMTLPES